MPKTKEQKLQIINNVADKFGRMKSIVFTQISGYTMEDANNLRAKAKQNDMEVFIAKKTLLALAAEKAGLNGINARDFEGSVLTAVSYGDEVAAAKVMAEFIKGREDVAILGGVLEGKQIDAAMVKSISVLPSKQELLSKLVGTINAPVSGFVNVLAGNLRGLVNVLNNIKESKA